MTETINLTASLRTLVILLLGCALGFIINMTAPYTHAQGLTELIGVEPLTLTVNPTFPAPNQNVIVTATSNEHNLSNASITWTLNGKPVQPTEGNSSITFSAGAVGTQNRLSVSARLSTGETLTKQIIIRPAAVDLIWEANSYIPPFYKGKALPAAGSSITITALPDVRNASGRKLSTSELIFTWQQSSRILGEYSGRGQNTITLPGPEIYRPFSINVEVTSLDKTVGASGMLTLNATAPNLILYENHPTLGLMFERSIKNTESIAGGEITIVAQPYFVSTAQPGDTTLRYTWNLNGNEVQNPSSDKSLILLRPTSGAGAAQVEVIAQNIKQIFQQGRQSFTIKFTGNDEATPFTASTP